MDQDQDQDSIEQLRASIRLENKEEENPKKTDNHEEGRSVTNHIIYSEEDQAGDEDQSRKNKRYRRLKMKEIRKGEEENEQGSMNASRRLVSNPDIDTRSKEDYDEKLKPEKPEKPDYKLRNKIKTPN